MDGWTDGWMNERWTDGWIYLLGPYWSNNLTSTISSPHLSSFMCSSFFKAGVP